jgi:hypothetical protein
MTGMNPSNFPPAWAMDRSDVVFPLSGTAITWGPMLLADREATLRLATKSAWYRGSVAGLARQRIQSVLDFGVDDAPDAVY